MDANKSERTAAIIIGVVSLIAFGLAIYANVLSIKVNRKALGKAK